MRMSIGAAVAVWLLTCDDVSDARRELELEE